MAWRQRRQPPIPNTPCRWPLSVPTAGACHATRCCLCHAMYCTPPACACPRRYGDWLRSGWRNVLDVVLRLHRLDLLPTAVISGKAGPAPRPGPHPQPACPPAARPSRRPNQLPLLLLQQQLRLPSLLHFTSTPINPNLDPARPQSLQATERSPRRRACAGPAPSPSPRPRAPPAPSSPAPSPPSSQSRARTPPPPSRWARHGQRGCAGRYAAGRRSQ